MPRADPSTNILAASYYLDNGASWTLMRNSLTARATAPRLAIQTGGNAGGPVSADVAWVEIIR